ncbi:hypothetical protein [Methanogenium cariaci]
MHKHGKVPSVQTGNRMAPVISMPPVCFMMKKLIEILDPVVAG